MEVEPETTLEDGEISDDEEVYKPLERPLNITNVVPRSQDKISDNDSDWSSKSDTDSDEASLQAKKPKIKLKVVPNQPKRKKYDIWSAQAQEEVLTETLTTCDVSRIDRSRNVESYQPFDLRKKINSQRRTNKRTHDQRNVNISMSRKDDSDEDNIKGSERVILDLVTTVDNTNEEVAKDIANKLCEEKDDLLLRIVNIAGKKKAIEIFEETKKIELDGGMLIMNQTRRRTPGGVFIFLLKRDDDVTKKQLKIIFAEEKREQQREKKAVQKAKLSAIKKQINARKKENLPELLTRAEVEKLSSNRDRNESEPEECVSNPPPSPVTDGKETSNDGMSEDLTVTSQLNRKLNSYGDDFLDLGTADDMDLF